jgi:excisionase family DNA binding protein
MKREVGSLLTVEEFAERTKLKPPTIRTWIARRRIAVVRLGRAIRIPAAELERLCETGFVPAQPPR